MADIVQGLVCKISSKKAGRGTVHNVCVECFDNGKEEWFGHGFDKPDFFEGDEIEFEVEMNGEYANINPDSVKVLKEGDNDDGGNDDTGRGSRGGSGRSSGGRSGSSRSGGRDSGRGSSGGRGGSSGGGRGGSSRGGSSGGRSGGGRGGSASRSKGGDDTKMTKEDWAEKDARITRHGALNTAIALVNLAAERDCLSLPQKKADRFDALSALVYEEAERIFHTVQDGWESSGDGHGEGNYSRGTPE